MAAGAAALLLNAVLVTAPAYADTSGYSNLSCPGVGVCTFDIPTDQTSTDIQGVYASSSSLDSGFYNLTSTPFNAIMNCTDAQVDEVGPDGTLLLTLQPYQGFSDFAQAQTATVCLAQPQTASDQVFAQPQILPDQVPFRRHFALQQVSNRDLDLGLNTGRRIHHRLDIQGRPR